MRQGPLIADPGFQSTKAWAVKHSAGFKKVGPMRDSDGSAVHGLGVLERPGKGERSTLSQVLKLERGRRYLLGFTYRTGYGGPHVGYEELFVLLNDAEIWRADLAVPDFPPPRARLLFDAPAGQVTLTLGKRGLKDSGQGWSFQSTLSDVTLRPAAETDEGEVVNPDRPIVVPVPSGRRIVRLSIQERFVRPGSDFSFEVGIRGAARLGPDERARLSRGLTLQFPGAEAVRKSSLSDAGRITVKGRLSRPGFFPFKVTFKGAGRNYAKEDYLVAVPRDRRATGTFDHHGYYLFLGRKGPIGGNSELAAWRLPDWKKLADWMQANGADTLWLQLNCYWLAYPSKRYPSLTDPSCANVKEDFLKAFIDYAHRKGIRVYLSFTTEDYVEGFAEAHPETRQVDANGKPRSRWSLCLENEKARKYILDVVTESFSLYPDADGIVVHPNEAGPDRHNEETKQAYLRETGKAFEKSANRERMEWYAAKCAEITTEMFKAAAAVNPRADFVVFECPWLIPYMDVLKRKLPQKARICVWHYLHHGTYLENPKLRTWVRTFGKDRVIYMPNGFDYGYPRDPDAQMQRHLGNDRLLSVAESLGYRSCIYYVHFKLDGEQDRLRDLMMAKHPTSSRVPDEKRKRELIKLLHEKDYYETHSEVFKYK